MTEDFGPQTAEVKALIEQIPRITPNQITKLAAAYDYASAAGRADAWAATWAAAWAAGRAAGRADAWAAAWDGAWAAVLALIVRDLISKVDFDTLYGPWASVMEVEDEA